MMAVRRMSYCCSDMAQSRSYNYCINSSTPPEVE